MSAQDNLRLGKKIYELFNNNEIEELGNLFSEDAAIVHVPSNTAFKGREGFKQSASIWKGAFSDARCEIKNMIANEDYIVTEFNGVGTNDGILETPMGQINPTGKKVNVPFVEIMKVRNGKVNDYKLYFDTATLMQQLEVITEKV